MRQTKLPIYELGQDFYDLVQGGTYQLLKTRFRNEAISQLIEFDSLSEEQWFEHFGQFKKINQNLDSPLALRYHGHQFRHYNPELGDGRGFLFSQFVLNENLFELGTKGSGTTPYSRRGDGRLTLKGAVREALCTAYLQFQSVNTSKTFSIVETGENLIRHDEPSPTRSSILFRFSHGHIRIGSFQRQLFYQNPENIRKLTDYCLTYFYPWCPIQNSQEETLLRQVTFRLADLVASYMTAGFVHGVLNTDNINISGESFDYGPYRFLPNFDPHFTAAYFDTNGLYCFGRQPSSFLWNLEQLKKCLVFVQPELSYDLNTSFAKYFQFHLLRRFLMKLQIKPKVDSEIFNLYLSKPESSLKNNFLIKDQQIFPFVPEDHKIDELLQTVDFKNAQELLDLFYQWLEGDPNLLYENGFFSFSQAIHGITNSRPSSEAFENLWQHFKTCFQANPSAPTDFVKYLQGHLSETLLINEIESIWEQIDSKNDWTDFENKLKKLNALNDVYHF